MNSRTPKFAGSRISAGRGRWISTGIVSIFRVAGLQSFAVGRSEILLLPAGKASGPSDVIRLSVPEWELAWPCGPSGHTASWQVERQFAKRFRRFAFKFLKTSVPPLSVGSRE